MAMQIYFIILKYYTINTTLYVQNPIDKTLDFLN